MHSIALAMMLHTVHPIMVYTISFAIFQIVSEISVMLCFSLSSSAVLFAADV